MIQDLTKVSSNWQQCYLAEVCCGPAVEKSLRCLVPKEKFSSDWPDLRG